MLSDQRTETIVPATASALQRVVEAQSLPASGVVLEMHIPRSQRGNRPMHGHPIGVGTAMDSWVWNVARAFLFISAPMQLVQP